MEEKIKKYNVEIKEKKKKYLMNRKKWCRKIFGIKLNEEMFEFMEKNINKYNYFSEFYSVGWIDGGIEK